MKKLLILSSVVITLLSATTANAQDNISLQPKWGPVGHDYVEYYYLPDIETYYSVPKHKYVHMNPAGKWVYSNGLPPQHAGYDLYKGYKVVINEQDAYKHHNDHKVKYLVYKGNNSQVVIRDSKEPKYKVVYIHSKPKVHGKKH